jgi:type IV pilus assembly protein PilN
MKFKLNLATKIYINRRALYFGYGTAIGFLLLMLCLNVMNCTRLQGHIGQLEEYLKAFPAPESLAEGRSKKVSRPLDKVIEEIRFANGVLEKRRFHWTQFLDQLEDLATDKIKIRSIQPNFGNKTVKLSGLAKNLQDLQKFLENLSAKAAFSDYFLLEQAQTTVGEKSSSVRHAVAFTVLVKGVI